MSDVLEEVDEYIKSQGYTSIEDAYDKLIIVEDKKE